MSSLFILFFLLLHSYLYGTQYAMETVANPSNFNPSPFIHSVRALIGDLEQSPDVITSSLRRVPTTIRNSPNPLEEYPLCACEYPRP